MKELSLRPLTLTPRISSTSRNDLIRYPRIRTAVDRLLTGPETPMNPANSSGDLNVLGKPLEVCGCQPLTGWTRDGFCRSDSGDLGRHTVCCVVDDTFLNYSLAQGNDLITPRPSLRFPGLKAGDHWCVCAPRWLEAYDDGVAPPVRLEATEISTLKLIPLELLERHAV
jgi:uncharacterized protein (DUF2237 family)